MYVFVCVLEVRKVSHDMKKYKKYMIFYYIIIMILLYYYVY